ncbi:serine-rich adhesin for platelets [Embiotoca jacksoni]|uniref:serine-rich adhesin for platelets n=1 Tax=Embiotoca jacksoni TaxID=100190 RepID=UPI0037039C9C
MDLSLLPSAVSEYNKQKTGRHFTVRSASSPMYSLTRREGVRRRDTAEEKREGHGTRTNFTNKEEETVNGFQARTCSVKGQREEKEASGYKMTSQLNQNGSADKSTPEFGTNRSENHVFESRGRTEWRRSNLSSRSKSLDWRAGSRNPDQGKTYMSRISTKRLGDISKQVGLLEERWTGVEGVVMGKVISSRQPYNSAGAGKLRDRSPVSHMSQTLDRASRGNSLPSRLRSESGSGSRFTETATSFGPKGGRSILERIEKLYGSAGFGKAEDSTDSLISPQQRLFEKTAGETFPRHFSSGEDNSSVQSRMLFTWSHKDDKTSSSVTTFPRTSTNREKSPGGQWQGQIQDRYSEEGGINWGRGFVETGTRSLDRARSRSTIADQIRSARAAGGMTAAALPFFEETPVLFRDSSGFKEKSSQDESKANHGDEKSETGGINGLLRERIKEQEKETETDDGPKEKTDLKSCTVDDVFETNSHKTTLKTTERKKFPEMLSVRSAASVRNKINQFEALTQRTVTGQVLMPRRTFSVPTQLSRGHDGVKKSGSAKEIGGLRDKWEGLKDGGGTEDKVAGSGKKLASGRSLSLDEVGLRSMKKETGGNDLVDGGENNCSDDDFGKYFRLKNTPEIPLNGGAKRCSRMFHIDETDLYKISSPEEASQSDMTANNTPSSPLSCDTSAGVQKRTSSDITSPLSDDDKTPTNIMNHSPFSISPSAQSENATPIADSENKSTSVITQTAKAQDPDSPHLPRPLATSSHSNLQDIISPDVKTAYPTGKKRVLDLNAWVAGLNPDYKCWKDNGDDYEDDDESTQKDEDSNYDSDSGESSVTITSNMSQSDRRSFCVSLSELCNFTGADYESENDNDELQSMGRRSASLSSDVSALSYVSVLPAEELDRLLDDVRSLGDNTLQDYDDVQVVVLHKEVGVGLGFSMAGGVDQNKPVTVHKVFHSGVAAQEGSIREGDKVLSINGIALCGSAHWEALRVLRRAKTRDMGVVVLRRGDVRDVSKKSAKGNDKGPTQTQYETGHRVCLQLQKNSRDLGFSLQGGVGSSLGNSPLCIQKIFQGGPVDKVCPGDEVLEIQGINVVGMRRLEAWTLIRRLPPGPVDVVLRRPLKHLET